MEHKDSYKVHTALAHPSLALVKYWGKQSKGINVPSTTSVAVTLSHLTSSVQASFILDKTLSNEDARVMIHNVEQNNNRIFALCDVIDKRYKKHLKNLSQDMQDMFSHRNFIIRGSNNFPTSAGLASSASGGAALTQAIIGMLNMTLPPKELSSLARVYSGSACRSTLGGFVVWKAGSLYAEPIVESEYWKDFRIIVLTVTQDVKKLSSRDAMSITRDTSPYYKSWIRYNNSLANECVHAIKNKDIEKIGEIAVRSYTAMHASSIAAYPSILYWTSGTIVLLRALQDMRKNNIPVWETMDAGPQIKLITLASSVEHISSCIRGVSDEYNLNIEIQECHVGTKVVMRQE